MNGKMQEIGLIGNYSLEMHLCFLINKLFIYLFIFGCVGSLLLHISFLQLRQVGATLRCSVRASRCSGFCCCGAQALDTRASAVVVRGLQSTCSVVVAHGLSCSAACGIFLDQGSNPHPLPLAGGFLTTAPPGKLHLTVF